MIITQNIVTKTMVGAGVIAAMFGGVMFASAATPMYDVSGTYVANFNYLGTDYAHDMVLAQSATGTLSGHGGSPIGANVYTWVVTSGAVSGNEVDFYANYTASADAVTPLTTMHVMGTVATTGVMSGTWTDNYQGGTRSGTWTTASGTAHALTGTLAAEDFGVVNYDTGLGMLKGYTAGFGLTDATFAGAQSVVVQLYSSTTLLQTNTAILAKFHTDITGTQVSSPFDVSGNFNYATDGYWVNTRAAQYGQSVPATRVIATVTLANGKVVTAENTLVTSSDPTTIYPTGSVVVPPATTTTPTKKSQCKADGWKTFTNPTFKNQGECVRFVEHLNHGVGHHDGKDIDGDDDIHGGFGHEHGHIPPVGTPTSHGNDDHGSQGHGRDRVIVTNV
jgi:hypothetical protein